MNKDILHVGSATHKAVEHSMKKDRNRGDPAAACHRLEVAPEIEPVLVEKEFILNNF